MPLPSLLALNSSTASATVDAAPAVPAPAVAVSAAVATPDQVAPIAAAPATTASPAAASPVAAAIAAPAVSAVEDDDGEDDAIAAALASAPLAAATPRAARASPAAAALSSSPASASPAARRRSPLPAAPVAAAVAALDTSAGSTSSASGDDDGDDPILAALSSRKAPRPAASSPSGAAGSPSSPAGAGTPPPLLQVAVRSAMLSARKAAAAKSAAASTTSSSAAGGAAGAASVLLFSPQLVGGGARGGYAGLYSARKQHAPAAVAMTAPAASPEQAPARSLQLSPAAAAASPALSPMRTAAAPLLSPQPSSASPASPDPIARLDSALAGLTAAEAVAARGDAPEDDGLDDRRALYGPDDYLDDDNDVGDEAAATTPASGAEAAPSGGATTDGSESSSLSPMQGTVVVLQTVPARPSTARDLGVGTFLTPVRRSLRVYRSALASAITQHQQQQQMQAAAAAAVAPGSATRHADGAAGGGRAKKSVKFASDVGATTAAATTPGSAGSHLRRQATPFHRQQQSTRPSPVDGGAATPTTAADAVSLPQGDDGNAPFSTHEVDTALGCEAEGGGDEGADYTDAVSTPSSASKSPSEAAAVVVRPGVGVSSGTLTGITTPGRRNALPREIPRPAQLLDGEGVDVVDVDAATPEQHDDASPEPVHEVVTFGATARGTPPAGGAALVRQQLPAGLFASPPPSLTWMAARGPENVVTTATPTTLTPVVARPGPFLGPRLAALQLRQQQPLATTPAFGTPAATTTPTALPLAQQPSPAAVTAAVARALIPGATLDDVPDHLAWVPNPALPGVTLRAGHLYADGGEAAW